MAVALLFICLLGFIPYLVLVWRAPEMRWPRIRSTILTFALLFRIGLLCLPAPLTTDTARYLWDGLIQTHGFNPYRYAPDAPELSELRDANWEQLGQRDVVSSYPPVLLLLFRLIAWLAPHPWMFRFVFTICDLLTFRLIVHLLRSRKQPATLALIWGLNPLVMLMFAGNAQPMSLAIMFFVTGLWLWQNRLAPLAAVAFALASLTHLFALPLAITLMVATRVWSVRLWLWFLLPLAAGYALFIDAGSALYRGLIHLAGLGQFNGSIYEILAGNWLTPRHALLVSAVALIGIFAWMIRHHTPPVRATLTMAGCLLLFSPTVHPAYVTWLVALVCLEFSLPWLMFSATVLVAYVARLTQLQTGLWVDAALTRWLEYMPVYGLLIRELWRKRFDTTPNGQ